MSIKTREVPNVPFGENLSFIIDSEGSGTCLEPENMLESGVCDKFIGGVSW